MLTRRRSRAHNYRAPVLHGSPQAPPTPAALNGGSFHQPRNSLGISLNTSGWPRHRGERTESLPLLFQSGVGFLRLNAEGGRVSSPGRASWLKNEAGGQFPFYGMVLKIGAIFGGQAPLCKPRCAPHRRPEFRAHPMGPPRAPHAIGMCAVQRAVRLNAATVAGCGMEPGREVSRWPGKIIRRML